MSRSFLDTKLGHYQNLVPGSRECSVSVCGNAHGDLLFTQLYGYLSNIFFAGMFVSSNCLNFF